ncbi:uncharacterized protein Eint_091030 [Encephalitozoon intestinalis ATCC 50506]|uniref:Uncharacterized protein n=1 Tax=Encephalitozoon intestinalis (strain ATCC 50506) TaxID=876142 RepID=E0S8W6_ENCIT|nr:uncharacterized protein Eint_091030 [Encephalitozoon intestinalis ATCC 50506]ADM12232.2 hypothetical protein Eint_091030 [Encephalitozoon intestinalis ATCC 50506]UTX46041.1 hypothetical protein GPK93_09g16270 [Encephalitozoon intestinalis]
MASQRILSAVDSINNLLKALPFRPSVRRCHDSFVPKEMVGLLRKRALESTLPILKEIIDGIKLGQKKEDIIDDREICSRREFATGQLRHLRLSMESEFEEGRINKIKDLLNEIEYYEKIGVKPIKKINVGKEMTLKIFQMLSCSGEAPMDPYIGEYLGRRICFFHESPSEIEISSLRTMLRFLQESGGETAGRRGEDQAYEDLE